MPGKVKGSFGGESFGGLVYKFLMTAVKISIVFGTAIPVIPQYIAINHTQNTEGFSIGVCFIYVLSNTVKVGYWLRARYDLAILGQSIMMLLAMFTILELVVRTKKSNGETREEHSLRDLEPEYFWTWTDLTSYFQATLIILIITSAIVGIFDFIPGLTESVGYFSVILDGIVPVPQVWQNYLRKSVVLFQIYLYNSKEDLGPEVPRPNREPEENDLHQD